ncbi:DUF4124 domain-containing protein [Luteimonas sp. R10]|uniref:DUF4124 domain-containing protein n=1 Tax=Luteimonas sp. R10 TaxID=3108176 RepID=UPI00308E76AF|nr:DUF4124 domain-containing protein [Luteimonas sp. R10]
MRLAWAVVLGLAAGGALAWWLSRDSPQTAQAKRDRAESAAAAIAEDAGPALYRWRDDAGNLQITERPPGGGRGYEKVDVRPREGIEVHGERH